MVLKSVEEHNAQKCKEREDRELAVRKTGVACPNCKEELLWTSGQYAVASFPPSTTRSAGCPKCKLTVQLEADFIHSLNLGK